MRYYAHHHGKGKAFSYISGGMMQAEREAQENVEQPLPESTLWVRFVFVDHAGIPKTKAVYRDSFIGRARAGVGLAKGVLALDPSGALHPESGLSPVGEVRLVPDPAPVRPRSGDGLLRHDGAGRTHALGRVSSWCPTPGPRTARDPGLPLHRLLRG